MTGDVASFVISIDLEMSWGSVHHGRPHDPTPYQSERSVVSALLEIMDRYSIAATWAVVGHLFLERCGEGGGVPHREIHRPGYEWMDEDWYGLDPQSSQQQDPTWYGPDLVESIRNAGVAHEIGSHSFGHIIVGDPGCDARAFRDDLAACRRVANDVGVDLRSFVYPRNSVGHTDVLVEAGYRAYRTPAPAAFANQGNLQRRILGSIDRVWPLSGSQVHPVAHDGAVEIPQTYLFDPGSKTANRSGTALWSALVRRRLRHAAQHRSLFHLWFHTHNLAVDLDRASSAMDSLLADARRLIDEGRLRNETMGAMADRLLGGPVR